MYSLLIWSWAVALQAGSDGSAIANLRQKVLADLGRLPNYTCSETIERSHRRAGARSFDSVDRVRIEVGFSGNREFFGWVGGEKLAEEDLTRLVSGTITNGDFALLARSLFTSPKAVFAEAREEERAGRRTLRYDYRVPATGSDWVLRVPGQAVTVGYQGSFWVDKERLDLLELNIAASDIPRSLGFEAVDRVLWYARTRIGSSDFLLPERAVMQTTELTGGQGRSEMRFHNCRQYTVESVLRFDEQGAAVPNPARAAADAAVALPDEFEAELVLVTEIDSDTAAVGDPFTAHLRKSVRRKSQTVIPQGAVVHGRIIRLEFVDGYRYLDLGFSYFDVNGARLDIATRENQLEVGQSHTSTVMINPVHGEAAGRAFNTVHRRVPGPIQGAGSRLRLSKGHRFFLKSTAKVGS